MWAQAKLYYRQKYLSLVRERRKEGRKKMGAFEDQVKMRAIELKLLFKKGIKVVGKSCKKGWSKVKNLRR